MGDRGVLFTAVGFHIAWGRGSSFPLASRGALTDQVVGSLVAPSPGDCYAVATLLSAIGLTVAIGPQPNLAKRSLHAVAAVFAARAVFGFAGRTDLLVAGSSSPSFRRNDRRFFAPLCALLAGGVLVSSRRRRPAAR